MTISNHIREALCLQYYTSPCGELILASLGDELCLCNWKGKSCAERSKRRIVSYLNMDFSIESSSILEQTKRQLDEYFAGHRKEFNIQLHPIGTDFQLRVWRTLLNIPYGETRSYMEIATSIGNTKGIRAVAQAIGANGINILIPCHRIIGSNHSLTGFSGGLDKKEFLLKMEKTTYTK